MTTRAPTALKTKPEFEMHMEIALVISGFTMCKVKLGHSYAWCQSYCAIEIVKKANIPSYHPPPCSYRWSWKSKYLFKTQQLRAIYECKRYFRSYQDYWARLQIVCGLWLRLMNYDHDYDKAFTCDAPEKCLVSLCLFCEKREILKNRKFSTYIVEGRIGSYSNSYCGGLVYKYMQIYAKQWNQHLYSPSWVILLKCKYQPMSLQCRLLASQSD